MADQAQADAAEVTHDTFSGLIGKTVTVSADGSDHELTLADTHEYSEQTKRDVEVTIDGRALPPRRAFSLTLQGPATPALESGLHEVSFPELGRMSLHVVPHRAEGDRMYYHITFC